MVPLWQLLLMVTATEAYTAPRRGFYLGWVAKHNTRDDVVFQVCQDMLSAAAAKELNRGLSLFPFLPPHPCE